MILANGVLDRAQRQMMKKMKWQEHIFISGHMRTEQIKREAKQEFDY